MPWAFERFLCPGCREFELKGHPEVWEFVNGVGNLTRKCQVQNLFFLAGAYQTHVVVSEHGAI